MVKIRIPKTDITVKTINYKGRDQAITVFSAMGEDGTLYGNCEAWGDRKAQLTEVMGTEKFLEAEKIEHQAQYNKYNVFFPRGSGTEAGFRGRGGGGWVPQGYRGKPVSLARYLELTDQVLSATAKMVLDIFTEEMKGKEPMACRKIAIEEARNLTQTYWCNVRDNVSFPDGCEPAAQPVQSSDSGTVTQGAGGGGYGANTASGPTEADLKAKIAALTDLTAAADLADEITGAEHLSADVRSNLHGDLFKRRRELKGAA